MKVICISHSEPIKGHEHVPCPVVGNEYTIMDDGWDKDLGEYYCLEEFGFRCGYSKVHFALLSTIDEKEFERNYNKQLA